MNTLFSNHCRAAVYSLKNSKMPNLHKNFSYAECQRSATMSDLLVWCQNYRILILNQEIRIVRVCSSSDINNPYEWCGTMNISKYCRFLIIMKMKYRYRYINEYRYIVYTCMGMSPSIEQEITLTDVTWFNSVVFIPVSLFKNIQFFFARLHRVWNLSRRQKDDVCYAVCLCTHVYQTYERYTIKPNISIVTLSHMLYELFRFISLYVCLSLYLSVFLSLTISIPLRKMRQIFFWH